MAKSNPLVAKARKSVRYLKKEGLITDEHALTIALMESLCAQWDNATSATQHASLAKEIRACIEALPEPKVKPTDDVEDFLDSLKEDA